MKLRDGILPLEFGRAHAGAEAQPQRHIAGQKLQLYDLAPGQLVVELHFGKAASADGDCLALLDLIPGGDIVGDLRDGVLAGSQALRANFYDRRSFEAISRPSTA